MSIGFKDMRNHNRKIVLNLIKARDGISRSELVKEAELTAPTISRIIDELINLNLVYEAGPAQTNVGRKPINLKFNKEAYSIATLDIRPDKVFGAITNLKAEILDIEKVYFDEDIASFNKIITTCNKLLKKLLSTSKNSPQTLGLGITIPGIVNSEKGIIRSSAPLGSEWENISLSEHLEYDSFKLFSMDNLTRALTLGEKWWGNCKDRDNFIYVYVGRGIGAGIMVNSNLYKGSQYNAAEIGHTTIKFGGELCRCGKKGCLETYCSFESLMKRFEDIFDICFDNEQECYEFIKENPYEVEDIIIEKLKYLGIGISDLVNTFNPEKIVISGWPVEIELKSMETMKYLRGIAQENTLEGMMDRTDITEASVQKHSTVKGAAALVLKEFFDPESQMSIETEENQMEGVN